MSIKNRRAIPNCLLIRKVSDIPLFLLVDGCLHVETHNGEKYLVMYNDSDKNPIKKKLNNNGILIRWDLAEELEKMEHITYGIKVCPHLIAFPVDKMREFFDFDNAGNCYLKEG